MLDTQVRNGRPRAAPSGETAPPTVAGGGVRLGGGPRGGSRQRAATHNRVGPPGKEGATPAGADESGTAGDQDPHLPRGLEAGRLTEGQPDGEPAAVPL